MALHSTDRNHASDSETPQEAEAGAQEAICNPGEYLPIERIKALFAEESREQWRSYREPTPKQREHSAKRTRFQARLAEEAEKINRARQQEGE